MSSTRRIHPNNFSCGPTQKQLVENAFKPLHEHIRAIYKSITDERAELASAGQFTEEEAQASIGEQDLNNQDQLDTALEAPSTHNAMTALTYMKPQGIASEGPRERYFEPEHMLLPTVTVDGERGVRSSPSLRG